MSGLWTLYPSVTDTLADDLPQQSTYSHTITPTTHMSRLFSTRICIFDRIASGFNHPPAQTRLRLKHFASSIFSSHLHIPTPDGRSHFITLQ